MRWRPTEALSSSVGGESNGVSELRVGYRCHNGLIHEPHVEKGMHEGDRKEATPYVRGPNDERRCLVTGLLLDDCVYVGVQKLACRVTPDVRESWNPPEIANDLRNTQHNHHEVTRATKRSSPKRRWRSE